MLMGMTRKAWILWGSLAAALAVVIVLLVVLIGAMQRQALEADYRACLASYGVPGSASVDETADAAERCHAAVYG